MSHQAQVEFSLKIKNTAKSSLITQLWVISGYFLDVNFFKGTKKIKGNILMT